MNFNHFSRRPRRHCASKSRKKGRSGWIAVNISQRRIAEMKTLARASGMTFRLFCELAFCAAIREQREILGLPAYQPVNLTCGQIAALAERHRLIDGCLRYQQPKGN
jgi:hypothetical protein